MSKILKSTTLGNVKNGGIFKALGKEFVKLDADEHGCLVLAKDIWTKMPFRDGDDPECPNDLRRSDVMKYLSDRFTEFVREERRWTLSFRSRSTCRTQPDRPNTEPLNTESAC